MSFDALNRTSKGFETIPIFTAINSRKRSTAGLIALSPMNPRSAELGRICAKLLRYGSIALGIRNRFDFLPTT